MVLGEDINDEEPTNLVSAAKNASYGLDTEDLLLVRRPPQPAATVGVASLPPTLLLVVLLAADI